MKSQLQQRSVKYSRDALRYGTRLAELSRRIWKQLGAHATFLGVALTLLIAGLDWYGHLQPVERIFYNARARYCQFFIPPPPDKLVHVDIDDAALEAIGRWPWPRTTLAEIIDELRLCGATELSTDILFADPQDPGIVRKPDGSIDVIDHDANLAAAIRRFGKVVIPVHFDLEPKAAQTAAFNAMVQVLESDLELLQEEIPRHLPPHSPSPTENEFLLARREAMTLRLEQSLANNSQAQEQVLRQQLLPRADRAPVGSSIQHEFDVEYQKAQCSQAMRRFALTTPASPDITAQVLNASEELTMTLPFTKAATASGFVDYFQIGRNPTIDMIPMCILYHGRLYPQMDLSLACAALGIDPAKIVVEKNRIVVPRPDGKNIVIPVHQVKSDLFGTVAMFMDIPWFGTRDWTTMYDYPSYAHASRHVPIVIPFAIADARKRLRKSNQDADKAVQFFDDAGMDSAKQYRKNPPGTDQINQRIALWESHHRRGVAVGSAGDEYSRKPAQCRRQSFLRGVQCAQHGRDQHGNRLAAVAATGG